MKFQRLLIGLAFLASITFFGIHNLAAQGTTVVPSAGLPAPPPTAPTAAKPPIDAVATVNLGNQSITMTTRRGLSDRVGLQPDQIVDVAVQFSAPKSGHTITVEPLDAGRIVSASNRFVVAADNTIKFTFQVGHGPGISQVCLHDGAQEIGLQFWVLDNQSGNNPPVINSSN